MKAHRSARRTAWTPRTIIFIGLTLVLVLMGADGSAQDADNKEHRDLIHKIIVTAEMLADGQAKVSDVLPVLGASAGAPAEGRIHRVDQGLYVGIVEPQKGKRSHLVNQVQIYPQPGLALKFSELASALGKWHELHRGQTSSVRFDFVNSRSKGYTKIFVQISSLPGRPEAMVLRVSIRAPSNEAQSRGEIERYCDNQKGVPICDAVKYGRMPDKIPA